LRFFQLKQNYQVCSKASTLSCDNRGKRNILHNVPMKKTRENRVREAEQVFLWLALKTFGEMSALGRTSRMAGCTLVL